MCICMLQFPVEQASKVCTCMYFQVTWRDLCVSNGRHHAVHSTYAGGLYSLFVLFCRNLKHMGMHVMAAVNSSADLRPTAASRPALDSLALNSKFHQKSTPTNPLTFHTIHHFYISASLPRHSQHTNTHKYTTAHRRQ